MMFGMCVHVRRVFDTSSTPSSSLPLFSLPSSCSELLLQRTLFGFGMLMEPTRGRIESEREKAGTRRAPAWMGRAHSTTDDHGAAAHTVELQIYSCRRGDEAEGVYEEAGSPKLLCAPTTVAALFLFFP